MTFSTNDKGHDVVAINDPAYWHRRFEVDWVDRGGPNQTAFFARLAIDTLPAWLAAEIESDRLQIYDFGCALGDALPILKSRFPDSIVRGGDVAASAIEMARVQHPEFRFDVLEPDGPPPSTDVHFCSNTLEHFKDWDRKLAALAQEARRHVIMLVPFAEENRLDEHEVTFTYKSLPLTSGGKELACVTTLDTSRLPNSRWLGRQMLAVYSTAQPKTQAKTQTATRTTAQASQTVVFENEVVHLDLRSMSGSEVTTTLAVADAFDVRVMHLENLHTDVAQLQASTQHLLTELQARTQHLLTELDADVSEHNTKLAMREAEIRKQVEGTRQVLRALLQSRSWCLVSAAIKNVQQLRGRPYVPLAMPPLGDMSIPRLKFSTAAVRGTLAGEVLPTKTDGVTSATMQTLPPEPSVARNLPTALVTVETLHRGGVEQVVVDLAMGLAQVGHRVVVAVSAEGGDCAETLRRHGIEVHEFGHDHARFVTFVETVKPVFALSNHTYFGLDILNAANVPIVEIVHNYYVWHQATVAEYRNWIKPVSCFAAVSTGVADYHARTFGIDRQFITVINNPINRLGLLRPEPPLLRRLRRNAQPAFTFINVAQFFPVKAHALLLSAFEEVRQVRPNVRLRLVGQHIDQTVTALVDKAIKRGGLADAVELVGFVDRRALSHLLASSHAFVQPSVYEGFSIAMAEAAHFALPMLTTRIGGAIDMIRNEDCGILIPPHVNDFLTLGQSEIAALGLSPNPHNRGALVAAMLRMVDEREAWQERGFIGQARIDALTPKAVAQRYVDLVSSLVQR
jgi:glycosyltransferase involved in cell wall biosynthesis